MTFELKLTGAEAIAASFDLISKSLTGIGKQLDDVTTKFQQVASAGRGLSNVTIKVPTDAGAVTQQLPAPPSNAPVPGSIPSLTTAIGAGSNASSLVGAINLATFAFKNLDNPVALVTAAIAGLAVVAGNAVQSITEFGDFQFRGKANLADASKLAGLSGAAGVSLDQVTEDAARRPGGAAQLIDQIKQFVNIKDPQQAARFGEALGLNQYRRLRSLNPDQLQDALAFSGPNANEQKEADQILAKFDSYKQQAERLAQKFAIYAIDGLGKLTDLLPHSSVSTIPGVPGKAERQAAAQQKAADKLSDAAEQLVYAAKDMRGAFGFGGRARGAFAPAFGWYGNQAAMIREAQFHGNFAG